MTKLTRFAISVMVGASIVLAGQPAFAQLDKCQAKLKKVALKLTVDAVKALNKCKNSIRKQQVKGKPLHVAAHACEKELGKVLGIPGGLPAAPAAADTKVGKFVAAVTALGGGAPPVCSAASLVQLGHLVSGVTAPGGPNPAEWTAYWLLWAKLKLAWLEEIFEVGDTVQVLNAAITATPDTLPDCDPLSGKGCGTWCPPPPPPMPANHVPRPNLCAFRQLKFPQCRVHSCNLVYSDGLPPFPPEAGAEVHLVAPPISIPVSLGDKKLSLQICKPLDTPPYAIPNLPVGAGYKPIIGDPGRTFQPPPQIPLGPPTGNIRVCIDQIRSQGWCDCVGNNLPFNVDTCLDHIQNNNFPPGPDDCGDAVLRPVESPCLCAGPPFQCFDPTDGSRCHPGTRNGLAQVTVTAAPGTGPGDCLVQNTIALKLLPQGICFVGGAPTGPCPTHFAACGAGGICIPAEGPDMVPCTQDDLVPPATPTTILFTTGTSTSTVQDAVATEGTCTPGNPYNCAHDDDCMAANGPGSACAGAVHVLHSQVIGPGTPVACPLLEASNLANWTLVGSFPSIDAATLNDSVTTFALVCE